MNHPMFLAAINVGALLFVAVFAWWWGRRTSSSLGAATLPPAAAEGGAHPDGAGHGDPLAVVEPPRGVPRLSAAERRHIAEQIEASGYGDEVQP